MNQEVKKKWLKKLEGARKAKGKLRSVNGGRCCLGHLCDLYIEEVGGVEWERHGSNFWNIDDDPAYPPDVISEWAELPFEDQVDLVVLNDSNPGFPIEAIKAL